MLAHKEQLLNDLNTMNMIQPSKGTQCLRQIKVASFSLLCFLLGCSYHSAHTLDTSFIDKSSVYL
jgi:hypothetical protein